MKRFFDWMVKGLEAAADRQCAKRELESKDIAFEAEKRGLQDAYDRQAQALHSQIKNLKVTISELEMKLAQKPTSLSPLDVAKKMKAENLMIHEAESECKNIVIGPRLSAVIAQASLESGVSFRQVLSGMIALTWPDKSQ